MKKFEDNLNQYSECLGIVNHYRNIIVKHDGFIVHIEYYKKSIINEHYCDMEVAFDIRDINQDKISFTNEALLIEFSLNKYGLYRDACNDNEFEKRDYVEICIQDQSHYKTLYSYLIKAISNL